MDWLDWLAMLRALMLSPCWVCKANRSALSWFRSALVRLFAPVVKMLDELRGEILTGGDESAVRTQRLR